MRYELFEEVYSIRSNDIREHDEVRCSIEADDEKSVRIFLVIELISPCMFDLNMVSCIVCLHTTFEMVQIDSSDDRRVDMCIFI